MKKTLVFVLRRLHWVFVFALLLLAFAVDSRYVQDLFVQVFLWTGLGCAWNLNCGYSRRFSNGHAVWLGLGAYVTVLLYENFEVIPWIGMVGGMLLCGALAFFLGRITLGLTGIFFTLTTMAFGEIVRILVVVMPFTHGSSGVMVPYNEGLINMSWTDKEPYLLIAFLYMLGLLLFCSKVEKSKFGYQLIATGEDRNAAEILCVDTKTVMTKSFVLSAMLTSLGGSIWAMYYLFISPTSVLTSAVSFNFVLYTIVGGAGMAFGPLIGTITLLFMDNLLRSQFAAISGLSGFLYGLIMLIVVLVRPSGLGGTIIHLYNVCLNRLHIDLNQSDCERGNP